ncbi:mRNA splicing protein [Coemansia sp. RSA 1722]|nr:mRNA splicing protein [Coemansia sp. RSA 1722]KAJ2634712.1 mRNA splicing protein [Coemansia sp. RSA 1286]
MSSSSKPLGSGKLSREDYKKQKDLEAARKAGTAPPEIDEEGQAINPHIPQFMAKAPWYMDTGKVGLQHQRKSHNTHQSSSSSSSASWYKRGERVGEASTKYQKGACTNCGAATHKAKDCVERPRKRGAKWTGRDLKADEAMVNVSLDYDAKRDRWNGYDAETHRGLLDDWEMVEEARRKRKAGELDKKKHKKSEEKGNSTKGIEQALGSSDDSDSGQEESDEENVVGVKSRSTVRNLRLREDTAKYLRNLDPESAYYDPKTRSMRENPYANAASASCQSAYAGDNFVRFSGEAQEIRRKDAFAWEAEARGNSSAHFQANPTQTAMMYGEFRDKKDSLAGKKRAAVLEKYGGEEHLKVPPRELRLQQEAYVEYSRSGQLVAPISGADKEVAGVPRSRFREDVYPMNHTTVFGSWWNDGRWGYACCRQTLRNAYCTGEPV